MNIKVAKWGNSLGIRIPKPIADESQLAEGDEIEIVAVDGEIVIKPCKPQYTLDSLLEGMGEENLHGEVDWGKPVGREQW